MPGDLTDARFRAIPLLAGLTVTERTQVLRLAEVRHYAEGEVVFRRGDLRQALVIVLEGRVRIYQVFNGQPETLAQLEPYAFIGEQALISPTQEHEQSATADIASTIVSLRGDDFLRLRRRQPHLAVKVLLNILATIADRLTHADTKLLTLYNTGKIASLASNLRELTSLVLRTVVHTVRAHNGLFVVFKPEENIAVIREAIGYRTTLTGVRLPLDRDPIFGRLARTGEDVVISREQLSRDSHWRTRYSTPGLLAVPIIVGKKIIGAICVGDKRQGQNFSVNNRLLLSIVARQTAVAVEEAALEEEKHLVEELERVYIKPL